MQDSQAFAAWSELVQHPGIWTEGSMAKPESHWRMLGSYCVVIELHHVIRKEEIMLKQRFHRGERKRTTGTHLHAVEGIKGALQLPSPPSCCNECIPDDTVRHDASLLHVIEDGRSTLKQHQLQPPVDGPHVLNFTAACMDESSVHLQHGPVLTIGDI